MFKLEIHTLDLLWLLHQVQVRCVQAPLMTRYDIIRPHKFLLKSVRFQDKVKLGLPNLKVFFILNLGGKKPPREIFTNRNM